MKKRWFLFIVIPMIALSYFFYDFSNSAKPVEASENNQSLSGLAYQIDPSPVLKNVSRLGINLSTWLPSQSESLTQNILKNPGFEGQIDRLIVIVSKSDKNSFSDDKGWGYPDHYWKEATFQVRTGKYAGTSGIITDSLQLGQDDYPQYFASSSLPIFEDKDVIVLSKDISSTVSHWYTEEKNQPLIKIDPTEHRPESAGSHALLLQPATAEPIEMNTQTGPLPVITGEWILSLWVKAEGNQPSLDIHFKRKNDQAPLFSETIKPTSFWKKYTFNFALDNQPENSPSLLQIAAQGEGTKIWLDDLWLGSEENPASPFRPELINALLALKPSFVREHAAVGDTMENRIAEPSKRKSWTLHSAGSSGEDTYAYSLIEFLTLCQQVQANPWIVVPTTFTDDEYQKLGEFLASHAAKDIFPKVVLEFGRENWNWTYRPTSIPYPKAHGAMADRAYEFILLGAKSPTHFIKTVNGQHLDPALSLEYLKNTKTADALAIAPYFFPILDKETSDHEAIANLLHDDDDLMKETAQQAKNLHKALSIYELNLHTTEGTATGAQRNRIVAGAISGTALAKKALEAIQAGADPIMIYSLLQHESTMWNMEDTVKLWGIAQKLGDKIRFRPTGLAVIMLNRICGGNAHQVNYTNNTATPLTILAFTPDKQWTAAVASASESPLEVSLIFPDDNKPLPSTLLSLESHSPFDNNEEEEQVKLHQDLNVTILDRTVSFIIPPYGFVILGNQEQTDPLISAITWQPSPPVAQMELPASKESQIKSVLKKFKLKRMQLEEALESSRQLTQRK